MSARVLRPQVLIIGAGVSGLWLRRRLAARGVETLTIERECAGGVQTLAAQGIIHGGIKYELDGRPSPLGRRVALAAARWETALSGGGPLDLREVEIRSCGLWLWTRGGGSQGAELVDVQRRVASTELVDAPHALRDAAGRGELLRVRERIISVPSLLRCLVNERRSSLLQLDALDARWELEGERLRALSWERLGLRIEPAVTVCCAGSGNDALLARLGLGAGLTQRRPLHMVILRARALPELHLHVASEEARPLLTVTSHCRAGGERCWYLGGELAERGVQRSPARQQAAALALVRELFPRLELKDARCTSFRVDRAERRQPDGGRPAGPDCFARANVLVGWPTKLALAPLLVDELLAELDARSITHDPSSLGQGLAPVDGASSEQGLRSPSLGRPAWEVAG